jgi:CAAX protease family protein
VFTDESAPAQPLIDVPTSIPQPLEQPTPAPTAIDPDNPPWGLLPAFIVWVLSVALLVVVPVILLIPYVVYKMAVLQSSTAALGADPNLIFISILGVLPSHALTFLLVWYVVTGRGSRPFWETLGWRWPPNFGPWKTVGFAVVLLGFGWLITRFVGGAETQLDLIIKSSYKARFVIAFLAAVTGPFVEELIYRGLLYPALQRVVGVALAVAIVSILFAGVHVLQYFNNPGVIAVITMLSVSLTVVRARTKSLLPSYVIHLVFNSLQAVLLILQPLIDKQQNRGSAVGAVFYLFSTFFNSH